MNIKLSVIIKKLIPQKILILRKRSELKKINKTQKLGNLNKDKIFYVINIQDPQWGVLSSWLCTMPRVKFALDSKYIPVIDYQNLKEYPSMLIDLDKYGTLNAWNLYFTQPQENFLLSDILKSSKVIFSTSANPINYDNFSSSVINGNLPLRESDFYVLKSLYERCQLNKDIIINAEELYKHKFPSNKKILGVSFRRCFERFHALKSELTPDGTHIVRITLEGLLEKVQELLSSYDYEYFFFTTDDRESLEMMKKKYGSKCIFNERPLVHHFENNEPVCLGDKVHTCSEFFKRENDVYLRNVEYLTDIYLLSKCDSLLSCGGTADLFAYIMKDGKYEHLVQPKSNE